MDLRFRCIPALAVAIGVMSAATASHAVNLVPNGSFESYVSCPTSFTQIYQAAPWDAPTTGTSDYLNACAPVSFPSVNVPQNEQGYQAALTGVGYAGIIPYSAAADYREYVQAPLTSPLVASASYLVKFYVSLADESILAIDRLGAYLSVGAVGPALLPDGMYQPAMRVPSADFSASPAASPWFAQLRRSGKAASA